MTDTQLFATYFAGIIAMQAHPKNDLLAKNHEQVTSILASSARIAALAVTETRAAQRKHQWDTGKPAPQSPETY